MLPADMGACFELNSIQSSWISKNTIYFLKAVAQMLRNEIWKVK